MSAMILVWVLNFGRKDTPVLMANNYQNTNQNRFKISNAKSLAVAAAMPIVAVPIQDVQLLDYAVAHETVNSTYGLTANVYDDIYLGLTEDPYTSDQQRERDQYELDDENWNEVVFEEVNGSSTAKLALHSEWIKQNACRIDRVVNLDLPEQGISGPFKITSIKHIIPQKKPVDDDKTDDYNYRPVTALFTHESNQVYTIDFDNGEQLGVTYQHPIYSTTAGDWKLAGELEIGEEVLTKSGNTKVVNSSQKEGSETVYNLEIKELHNFLVGKSGVVVHNNYMQNLLKGLTGAKGLKGTAYDDFLNTILGGRTVKNTELGPWQQREYDVYVELGNKKILGEAKSGNALNHDLWVSKNRSSITQQNNDAIANGYEFYLFSNTPIPSYVKTYCNSKGIPFVETLD